MTTECPVEWESKECIQSSTPIFFWTLTPQLLVQRIANEVLKETAKVDDELDVDTLENLVLVVKLNFK